MKEDYMPIVPWNHYDCDLSNFQNLDFQQHDYHYQHGFLTQSLTLQFYPVQKE